jgi:AAA15 family ATPase/GTPase
MQNKNFFTDITIENFKSLRKVELKDCKRINVLIGKPNVGKSNILEALSFFSLPHNLSNVSSYFNNALEFYIRCERNPLLFFDADIQFPIKIQTNILDCTVTLDSLEDLVIQYQGEMYNGIIKSQLSESSTGKRLKASNSPFFKAVKRYIFKSELQDSATKMPTKGLQRKDKHLFLTPPYGTNLLQSLFRHPSLVEDFAGVFKEYGLGLFLDQATYTMRIVKPLKKGNNTLLNGITLPYSTMADTLQRIIFYKTAIVSNKDSILLFEEPEAHAFAPYIVDITQEMIQSTSNLFFITTHSPFVLNDLLENGRDELAVFLMDWQDGASIIKRLTDDEIYKIYQYGVDIFTNLETFI